MTNKTVHRLAGVALGAGALVLGLGSPASAHIGTDVDSVPAGAYTAVSFTVPHGCDGSPTRELAFSIPDGIDNAAPQVVAGWDIATTEEPLEEPAEGGHGDATTRVSEIVFTAQAGNELPDAFREVFTIGFQAPDAEGDTLLFPVVQRCTEGETAWIEETEDGAEEPDHPAPVVTVSESTGDGHGHGADDAEDGDDADAEVAAATAGTAASSSDDGDSGDGNGLAVGGLVLGALGLAAGGTALVRTRTTD